ncbi:MAG: ATP-binding protein [Candidatus Brevundimonas phytovorans]|nr:ATP-binding protein [Brevundimonas sp.]WEK59196.1 MAG: ATP-binding protein [Brevundimonas sp.]
MLIPQKPHDEIERLAMVRSLGTEGYRDDTVLAGILDLVRRHSGAPAAFISLLDEDHQKFIARSGLDLTETDRSIALCGHTILHPEDVLWVPDARLDERFHDNPLVVGPPAICFYAGAPLVVNGRAVGSLCLVAPEPREHDAGIAVLLQDLSRIVAERLAGLHRYRALERALEAASDAVIMADENSRYIHWSIGAERLFGYSAAEALGQTGELIGLTCHDIETLARSEGFEPRHGELDGARAEAKATCKDGSIIDVEVSLAVWHENGVRRTSATLRNISERKAQKAALIRSKTEAEAASVAKSAFLANMSHELRTPLNGVIGVVELLTDTPLSDHQKELAGIIQTSADQLRSLIGDILDLARIESGEIEIAQEVFDLSAEVERACQLCALKASEKGLDLVLCHDDDIGLVVGDPLRLRQVIINLLNNAIKFTDSGSVSISVMRLADDVFRFEVWDTGIGFSQEQSRSLFERFQQADGGINRRYGGTGLGLSICRELVEAMGGSIDCRSTPGTGSAFWFDIKLPQGRAAPEREAAPAVEGDGPRLTHILVADDSETNRRVAELILSAAGIMTTAVEDGVQAVEACRATQFDAVLMDMMMPQMDGLEATRAIRDLETAQGLGRTPIIMLTANTLAEHVARALLAGADLHLPKPITASALYEALDQISASGGSSNVLSAQA